jgi:signal transduction histidine kinase
MKPRGFAPRRGWDTGTPGDVTTGPAVTTLRVGATRTVAILRCTGIACVVAQVVIWHSYYRAVPWRLAGPVAAVAWGTAAIVYVTRRWPSWRLAVLDSAFYMVLALGARWYVPPVLRGDTSNWLDIVIVGQLVSPAWFTPIEGTAVLALGTAAAYWAGADLTPPGITGSAAPATAEVMMIAVALAASIGRRMLLRRAVTADAALERDDQSAREQYVLFSRYAERREHERMLHDTILNTLTVLARADGATPGAVGRCRTDVALIEHMLGDPDDIAGTEWNPLSRLLEAIEDVAGQLRPEGLTVSIEAPDQASPAPALSAQVVRAATYAVREALTNVVRHAGTGRATVEIGRPDDGGLLVIIRDDGKGFDPARVDPARLGLRRSIVERVTDQGGQASIESAPGAGTVVRLRW